MQQFVWLIGVASMASVLVTMIGPDRVRRMLSGDILIGPADRLDCSPDAEPPIYDVPADALFGWMLETIGADEGVEWRERDPGALYARAVVYSPVVKFPITAHLFAVPVDKNSSTLVLFATAGMGSYDQNFKRMQVKRWLKEIDTIPRAA